MKLDEFGTFKLTVKGNMTEKLRYLVLRSGLKLPPTTIYFFINGNWSNEARCKNFCYSNVYRVCDFNLFYTLLCSRY